LLRPKFNQGFVKSLLVECGKVEQLDRLAVAAAGQPRGHHGAGTAAAAAVEAKVTDICPRTCPTARAAQCTYRSWFQRYPLQNERQYHRTCELSAPAPPFRLPRFAVGSGPPQQPACATP